jgi:hypothetical protein
LVVESEKQHASTAIGSILESHVFQKTHRLSELLAFLADQTQPVKEAEIGHSVFGRQPGYNTSDDTIVRANIRQLRMKLDEYYQTEGLNDPWRVSIPKGSYALRIEPHALPIPAAEPPRDRRVPALLAGAAALACAGFFAYARLNQPAAHTLLSLLNPGPGQRLLIIGPDANVQLYQRLTHHTVSLQEYQNRDYLRSPELGPNAAVYFSSSITESFILNLIPPFTRVIPPEAMLVRSPDLVRLQDFQFDNALLISGPFGNPWVQLFDKPLNFQIQIDDEAAPAYIVNRNPLPGEPSIYRNYTDDTKTTVCFARLAYLPGLTPRTHVLLAGGPHQASTEAVNFFLTRSDQLDLVRRSLHLLPGTPLPSFEAVVEARAMGRDPWTMKFAAIRRVAP